MSDLEQGISTWPWSELQTELCERGFAVTPKLLNDGQCAGLIQDFEKASIYRKRVVMEKHDYGRGVYQYFDYPLPPLVSQLRQRLYEGLVPVANLWQERLNLEARFPQSLEAYTDLCHQEGQTKPTPLVLRYGSGDFNRLHRDLYGDQIFPMQVVFLLNEPGVDFQGGELVLVSQKPRSQSRAHVVPLQKGQGVIFAVNQYPTRGVRGYRRLKLSHGVSDIRAGWRHTLGIIFHDAR